VDERYSLTAEVPQQTLFDGADDVRDIIVVRMGRNAHEQIDVADADELPK
jgi:hypothetical protein